MGKESSAPKPPSYSSQKNAAKKLTEAATKTSGKYVTRAEDQREYLRDRAQDDRSFIDTYNEKYGDVADRALGVADTAGGIGKASSEFGNYLIDRYKSVYTPLEDDLITEYKDYASPGRFDLNRGRAMSDVSQQYDAARRNATRELESYGINPASTRYAALDLGVRTQQAAAAAAAANQADQATEAKRDALRTEAIGYGLKLPGLADEANSVGIQAGNTALAANKVATDAYDSATANRLKATAQEASITGTPIQYGALGADYLNAGTSANQSGANIAARGYDQSLDAAKFDADQSTGWGDVLGLAAGIGTKAFFGAEGGAIPAPGAVPDAASPSGGQKVDDVKAQLTAGEFVLPEDVTRWIGEKKLQDMIIKARDEKKGAGAKPKQGQAIPGPVTYTSRPGVGAIPNR